MKETFKNYTYDNMNYIISNYGRIFGVRGELKQRLNKDGYLQVTLGRDKGKRTSFLVHRLVAILFVKNPNNFKEVNHKDYNRANPKSNNLEWMTHVENIRYSSNKGKYGLGQKGENNIKAKLKEFQVLEIRKLYKEGFLCSELAKKYKIGWSTVNHIIKRETWIHI